MYSLVIGIHIFVAVMIVIAVLLQQGKGGGLGSSMGGGGANTLFGSSGGSNFFTKLTTGLAVVFMITSISLGVLKGKEQKTSIFDQNKTAPAAAPAASANTAPQASAPIATAPQAAPANQPAKK